MPSPFVKACLRTFMLGAGQSVFNEIVVNPTNINFPSLVFNGLQSGLVFTSPEIAAAVIMSIDPSFVDEYNSGSILSFVVSGVASAAIGAIITYPFSEIRMRRYGYTSYDPAFYKITRSAVLSVGHDILFPYTSFRLQKLYPEVPRDMLHQVPKYWLIFSIAQLAGTVASYPAYKLLIPNTRFPVMIRNWFLDTPSSLVASIASVMINRNILLPMLR